MTGQQSHIVELPKQELKRQEKNYLKRQKTADKTAEKKHSNFYTIDTETDGFPLDGGKNEPIQIVATMHREGEESRDEFYSKYFLPRGAITESALKTHKLDLEALKEKGAK